MDNRTACSVGLIGVDPSKRRLHQHLDPLLRQGLDVRRGEGGAAFPFPKGLADDANRGVGGRGGGGGSGRREEAREGEEALVLVLAHAWGGSSGGEEAAAKMEEREQDGRRGEVMTVA